MNTPAFLPWLTLITLLAAGPAHAANYCVGTPAQFQTALDQAELDADDSLIQVRAGTYNLTGNLTYQPDLEYYVPAGRLVIRGGYNADCSDYTASASATVLNGSGTHVLRLRSESESIVVGGLTLQSAFLNFDGDIPNGYLPEDCSVLITEFTARRIRIDGGSLHVKSYCHEVLVENALITNGVAMPGGGAAADTGLYVYLNEYDDANIDSRLTVLNSSVINGRTRFPACCDGGQPLARLYNSIFDYPAGSDIVSESLILARYNRYDGISFGNNAGLFTGSENNIAAAPQLNAQYVPNAGSAMVNSGTSTVPDGLPETDMSGGERVIGARVDRGALESPVDGTGVYVVTNANANGVGSLAWALDQSNAETGVNQIRFNIAGSCPRRITLTGSLQVHESVNFDGWSQPGNVRNSNEVGWNGAPCVILDGGGTVGIGIETMGDLASAEGSITVRGLAFERFALAISLAFGENHAIYGNQFGGRVGSSAQLLRGNEQAIALIGGGRSYVGNYGAETRNLIGDSSDVGVLITTFLGLGGDDNRVINNLIGLDKNASLALANGTGIRINGGFNYIIDNRIGGNTEDGILLSGSNAEGNVLTGNHIGGGIGSVSFTAGNGRMGVMVQADAHDNRIGPGNLIGRNGDDGVRIFTTSGGRNEIAGNRISRNSALGIDLGANGVTSNDTDPQFCDPELGCAGNRDQNYPVLATAIRRRTGLIPVDRPIRVTGTLRSTIGGPYRVELFASDSCESNDHGEGNRPLASVSVTIPNESYCPTPGGFCFACTSGNCTTAVTAWLPELDVEIGDVITATATGPRGDTSEFSGCMEVVDELANDLIFADDFEN